MQMQLIHLLAFPVLNSQVASKDNFLLILQRCQTLIQTLRFFSGGNIMSQLYHAGQLLSGEVLLVQPSSAASESVFA